MYRKFDNIFDMLNGFKWKRCVQELQVTVTIPEIERSDISGAAKIGYYANNNEQ